MHFSKAGKANSPSSFRHCTGHALNRAIKQPKPSDKKYENYELMVSYGSQDEFGLTDLYKLNAVAHAATDVIQVLSPGHLQMCLVLIILCLQRKAFIMFGRFHQCVGFMTSPTHWRPGFWRPD